MRAKMISMVGAGLVAALLLGGAGVASAGDKIQTRDRDQLRDGSCQVAAAKTQNKDRLRDDSCTVAGDQLKSRTRTRDC
jgi:hypothetical protein